jgi:peptide chain release factor 1
LLAAYLRYARQLNLACEIVYDSDSSWSVHITGNDCWEAFRHESGKHVVQRIPVTESKGRRHTSVVAVAVLPLQRQIGTGIPVGDVEIITQRGHGKGGQHQNKVESAVRAIHKPTGLSVFINGRDQFQNKKLALEILEAEVSDREREIAQRQRNQLKIDQLGSGSRSGKLRTYNFINGSVVDHRSGRKTHKIEEVMKGKFDPLR